MSARRALITGITGQDGSYLAERLLADGDQVVGVVRPPLDRDLPWLGAIRDDVELVEGDLGDPAGIADAIHRARADDVWHLAAPTFVPRSWDDPASTIAQIAAATATVLLAARDAEARALVVSSPEIFGDAGGASPQDEDSPRRPGSPYGVAKLAAHELVRVLRGRGDLHACAVVTYNHESPRRPERFVTRKITRAAAAISLHRESEVELGDLDARRDWSHAVDIIDGLCRALRHDTPADYVLGSGVARTVREFAEAAFGVVGLDAADHVRVNPDFMRPAEPTTLVADPSRARRELGWSPSVSFEELVHEMVEADLRVLRAT